MAPMVNDTADRKRAPTYTATADAVDAAVLDKARELVNGALSGAALEACNEFDGYIHGRGFETFGGGFGLSVRVEVYHNGIPQDFDMLVEFFAKQIRAKVAARTVRNILAAAP